MSTDFIKGCLRPHFYFLEDDYDYNLAPQVFDPLDGIQRSLDSDGKILMSDEGGAAGGVDKFIGFILRFKMKFVNKFNN